MLMMNEAGTLYILKAYDFKENQLVKKKTLFGRERKDNVSYIASLTFDKHGTIEYESTREGQSQMRGRIYNELVPDRARYINMCKHLSQYGYTIKRK
jgi:hypothetical protein